MAKPSPTMDQQLPDELVAEMALLSSKAVAADFLVLVDEKLGVRFH